MLIYEKTVNGTRGIYGTFDNVPSDADEPVKVNNVAITGDAIQTILFDDTEGGLKTEAGTAYVPTLNGVALTPDQFQPEKVISTEAKILSFKIGRVTADIDDTTITATLPTSVDLTKVTPKIVISGDATIKPEIGETLDLTSPVTYTVTAEDKETTAEYTVTLSHPEDE